MKTKPIEITEVTVDELADKVADKLLEEIKHYIEDLASNENDIFLTRTEKAEYLKADPSTLWNWTNEGKLKSYGLGNRRSYNKNEIIDLLRKKELRHR